VRSVTELRLPEYQAETMASDLPARDVLISPHGAVWVLGKRAVWAWQLDPFRLQRRPLHERSKDPTPLAHLGTDGANLFAASAQTLYQVSIEQGRTFRYHIPESSEASRSLGFTGAGDDFWVLHDRGFWRFDRYGKKLVSSVAPVDIDPKDHIAFDGAKKTLWLAHGNELQRIDLTSATPRAKTVLKAKHELLDVQLAGPHLVVHTAHTVLRVDPATGKLKQSVPVEGRRRLVLSVIEADRHAYLFDDRLLEVFSLSSRTAARYRLPIDNAEDATRMVLAHNLLVMIADGRPRVFRLDGLQ
jgi:hypothetical protein